MNIIILTVALLGMWTTPEPSAVYYSIQPVPAIDRTNLEISVSFESDRDKPVAVKLPIDLYGTPNLSRYVTSFDGMNGSKAQPGKDENERLVYPSANGGIQLKYVLFYDPIALRDVTFAPNVGPKDFHVAGCQWMLQIGEASQARQYVIEISTPPGGWKLYSSIDSDSRHVQLRSSYKDLSTTMIGGGAGYTNQFNVKSKPVSVFVQGKFNVSNTTIYAAVTRIVNLQRGWFKDYDQPFYHVVVLPKSDNVAGTRVKSLFVCFVKSDVTRDQLYVLLAHEMLHNWLASDLIKSRKGEPSLRYQWFYEGFTDYFARKILADAGLISHARFTYLINSDVINIADNPNRNATYSDLIKATETGKFGQHSINFLTTEEH
jgi:predicted metalloprotease with PDZ domain